MFQNEWKKRQEYINEVLDRYLPETEGKQATVLEAMNYSVRIGGKRLRPVLMSELYRAFSEEEEADCIEPFLAAMEMLHTYSLVHDDLPAMDNDRYRRGQLTTHAKYGEAMGILAGDALLNYAFETACKAFSMEDDKRNRRVALALKVFAAKAGIFGMIGGQTIDVEKTGMPLDEEEISLIYEGKTCALIEASVLIGAILGGAEEKLWKDIEQLGSHIGMAFQIRDDILDVIGEEEKLGKPLHSDEKNNKTTYVTLYGLTEAEKQVKQLSETAKELARKLPEHEFLLELITYLTERDD